MGQSTISMAIFNSFLYVYQRVPTLQKIRRWLPRTLGQNSLRVHGLQVGLAQGAPVLAAEVDAVVTRSQVVELEEVVEPSDAVKAKKRLEFEAFFLVKH